VTRSRRASGVPAAAPAIRTARLAWAATAVLALGSFSRVALAHGERDLPSEDKPSVPVVVAPVVPTDEWYSIHYEFTGITQYHPSFYAPYSGPNSLGADAEDATAFVTTIFSDTRLWPGSELLFNPEMSGGRGLSKTLGVGAFPNGIVYRVGDPAPAVYLARLAISQTFPLGGGKLTNEHAKNELAGTRDKNQLAVTVGRLSVIDVLDANRYANDATDQFLDWALFASGAYDYPADTRGYTWGVLADLAYGWWSLRGGIALEPMYANLETMDWRVDKSRGLMAEYEARYKVGNMRGAWSLLGFVNQARMGSYEQWLAKPSAYPDGIVDTRADGRTKYGFALSLEQQLNRTLGAFMRLSWNDGHNESWAFTEIDQSLALGVVQEGLAWNRPGDEIGAAVVVGGLSPWHRRYLEEGGTGFILGDGKLNYGPEVISDLYYKFRLTEYLSLSAFYQPIVNPGYNQDRGPVHVFSGRFHVAF
jgi:high affinity Mn2+ porin